MFPVRWLPICFISQILFLSFGNGYAWAQAGALDPAFQSELGTGTVTVLTVQTDGKVIVGGAIRPPFADRANGVFRLNADGSRDRGFSADVSLQAGSFPENALVKAVAVQADGGILVGGPLWDDNGRRGILRLLPNGARDANFAPVLTMNGYIPEVQAIVVQTDGRIVIAGDFKTVNTVPCNGLARLNADGSLDISFQTPLEYWSQPVLLALQPDGKILAAGSLRDPSRGAVKIARLLPDGSLDATFAPSLRQDTGGILGFALQNDGRIVLAGSIFRENTFTMRPVVRLLPDGAHDATFTAGVESDVVATGLAVEPNGKVLTVLRPVYGSARSTGRRLVRLKTDGALDTTFVPGVEPDGDIRGVAALPDGKLFAGGVFTTWDGWSANGVAKLFGGDVATAPTAPTTLVAMRKARTIAALSWQNTAGANGSRIERLEGSAWREIGRAQTGETSFLDHSARPGVAYQYRITAWNGLGSSPASTVVPVPSDPASRVGSVDLDYAPRLTAEGNFSSAAPAADGKIFVVGTFHYVNGTPHRNLARFNMDGTPDEQFFAAPPSESNLAPVSLVPLPDRRVAVCYGVTYSTALGSGTEEGTRLRILTEDGRIETEIVPAQTTFPFYSTNVWITRVANRGNVIYYVKKAFAYYNSASSVEAVGLAGVTMERPSFNGDIRKPIPLANGSVLVHGAFTQVTSPRFGANGPRQGLARLKADLSLDEWLPTGLPVAAAGADRRIASVVAVEGDTLFVALNEIVTNGRQTRIYRLLESGAIDPAFTTVSLPVVPSSEADPFANFSIIDGAIVLRFSKPITITAGPATLTTTLLRYDATGALNEAWSRTASSTDAKNFFVASDDGRALIPVEGSSMDWSGTHLRPQLRWLNADGSPGATFATAERAGSKGVTAVRADGVAIVNYDGFSTNSMPAFTAINGTAWTTVAALREDGSLDAAFGFETALTGTPSGGGILSSSEDLRFDSFDRLLVSGSFNQFNGVARNALARLNADGTTDENFIPELPANFSTWSWAIRPDGRVFAGTYSFFGSPIPALVGLLADGRVEPTIAGITNFSVVAVEKNGAALFTGNFQYRGAAHIGLGRLTASNQLDPDYAPTIEGGGFVASPTVDGKVVIAGSFHTVNGATRRGLARLNADGSLDATFDPETGIQGLIYGVAVQADGKVIIVGDFTSYCGTPCARIARLNTDATLDTEFFAGETDGAVRHVAILSDGRLVIEGDFSTVDGLPRTGLARLLSRSGPVPPNRPIGVTVTRSSETVAIVSWIDGGRETGWRVERRLAGESQWTTLGNLGADVTTFTDPNSGSNFEYRVIAFGTAGESDPAAAIEGGMPTAPRGLTATPVSPYAIRLNWNAALHQTEYRIERSADGGTTWAEIAIVAGTSLFYKDDGLPPNTRRAYRVTSASFAGKSAPSRQASVVTWPEIFPASRGNWTGLVSSTGAFAQERSGSIRLSFNILGDFTGQLIVGTQRAVLKGRMSNNGTAFGSIAGLPGVLDGFTFSLNSRSGEFTGSLKLTRAARATVRILQAGPWSAAAPCPHRGEYTVLFSPAKNQATAPAGSGFARITVDASGTLQLAGMLPDGTVLSQGTRVAVHGEWPLFCRLYGGTGGLSGWTMFSSTATYASFTAPLRWVKPALPSATVNREAFSITMNLEGASYIARQPVYTAFRPIWIEWSGSDLPAHPDSQKLVLHSDNGITSPSGPLNMSLAASTGLFTGTFTVPGEGGVRMFRGAVLQTQNRGGGFFRGYTRTGSVSFREEEDSGGGVIIITN